MSYTVSVLNAINKGFIVKSIKGYFFRIVLSFLLVVGLFGISTSFNSPVYAKIKVSDQKEEMVYITKTGKKYHRAGCRYLKYSRYKITKEEAISRDYAPCKICRP